MRYVFIFISTICLFFVTQTHSQDVNTIKTEGDGYWKNRDHLPFLEKALDAYSKVIEIEPDNKKVLSHLTYGYFLKGYFFVDLPGKENKEKRQAAFTKGIFYAEKILKNAPDDPTGHFYYIVNKVLYQKDEGALRSAFLIPEIRKRMDLVLEKDHFFEIGGPQRVYAGLILGTPKMLRPIFSLGSLEDAEKAIKEVIAYAPEYIMDYIYLADIYIRQNKMKLAKETLQTAIDYPIDPEYCYAPENRRDKHEAIKRMKQYFNIDATPLP